MTIIEKNVQVLQFSLTNSKLEQNILNFELNLGFKHFMLNKATKKYFFVQDRIYFYLNKVSCFIS